MKTNYRIDSSVVGNPFNVVTKYPQLTIHYRTNKYSRTGVHYLVKGRLLPKRQDVVKSFQG